MFRGPQGERGPKGDKGESSLVDIADEIARLIRAKSVPKWWGWALTGLLVVVLAGGVYLGFLGYKTQQLAHSVQSGAVASCQAGNSARDTNKRIWDEFLTLAVNNPEISKTRESLDAEIATLTLTPDMRKGLEALVAASWTPNPDNKQLVQGFENYIAAHEYPVDCSKVYSPRATGR